MQADDARIVDIVLAAAEIADYVAGKSFQQYVNESLVHAAVERQVYIIGEAARQLSPAFKARHPSIPWAKIVGARNVLAHDYTRVNHSIMWETATVHVPALADYLKPHLPPEIEE